MIWIFSLSAPDQLKDGNQLNMVSENSILRGFMLWFKLTNMASLIAQAGECWIWSRPSFEESFEATRTMCSPYVSGATFLLVATATFFGFRRTVHILEEPVRARIPAWWAELISEIAERYGYRVDALEVEETVIMIGFVLEAAYNKARSEETLTILWTFFVLLTALELAMEPPTPVIRATLWRRAKLQFALQCLGGLILGAIFGPVAFMIAYAAIALHQCRFAVAAMVLMAGWVLLDQRPWL